MATLMDVFNSFNYAVSPFLRQGTEELKERNDLELKNYAARFATDVQNWIRDNPYDGNFDKYSGKLEDFAQKRYAEAETTQTSAYSREMLNRMRTQSLEMLRNHALVEQDKWEVQQAVIRYQSDKQMYMESAEPPEIKLEKIETALKLLSTRANHIGPEAQQQELESVRKAVIGKAVTDRLDNVRDVAALPSIDDLKDMSAFIKTRVAKLHEDGNEKGKPVYDEDGNPVMEDRKWDVDENWLQKQLDFAKERIYKQHMNDALREDAVYRRLLEEGEREEEFGKIRQAYAMGDFWRDGVIDQIIKGDLSGEAMNYAPEDHDRVARLFMPPSGARGSRSGREISDSDIIDARKYYIQGVADGTWTHEEGKQLFTEYVGDLAKASGDITAFEKKHAGAINFLGFWKDSEDYLSKIDPAYKTAFEVMNAIVEPWQKKAKTDEEKELRIRQGRYLGMYLYDKYTDEKAAARMTPEQIVEEARTVAAHLVGEKISFIREAKYEGGVSKSKFAEILHERAQHPWARFTIGQQGYDFGRENYEKQFMEQSRDFFSQIAGVPVSSVISSHDKEGEYDETAERTFQIVGEKGNYRFGSDGKKYWVEEMVDGDWKKSERFTKTTGEAKDDEKKKIAQEYNDELREAHLEKTINQMKTLEGNDNRPDVRRQFGKDLLAMHEGTRGGIDEIENKLWKEGINIHTGDLYEIKEDGLYENGKKITKMPAPMWDSMLEGMNSAQQKVQKEKWQAAGISRDNK